MNFIPDQDQAEIQIPYYEDAHSDDGWQGHATNESAESLRAQISAEIGRLGGTVTRWMKGIFHINEQERQGIQIAYQVVGLNGEVFQGRIDVAGLPFKLPYGGKKGHGGYKNAVESKKKKSLTMALYNVREALKAMRILRALSPGYAALIPWLLVGDSEKTIGEAFISGSGLPALSSGEDIVETTFKIIEESEG